LEQAANVEHILSSKTGVKKKKKQTLSLNDLAESVFVPNKTSLKINRQKVNQGRLKTL
jgi:hypothetical protein